MRAIRIEQFGGPEAALLAELPAPAAGPDQVRIAVHAAGVNFADTLMVRGRYQATPPLPFTPGMELAGEVIEAGKNIKWFKPGDRAIAILDHGGFAEEAVAHYSRIMHIPEGMSYEEAAGMPIVYGTSHLALTHRANLRPGEMLLVHGAAGGAGLTAVEIGKALGATVIAAASTPEKRAVAKDHGADHLIDSSSEVVHERVRELTDGRGADVIYDPVGGDAFDASMRGIAWEGRLLVVGFASGRIPSAPANYILLKNCSLVGVIWGAYLRRDPAVVRRSMEELIGWYGEGKLKPHISATFPLADAAEAMNSMMARKSTGKIVLTMD
jgi:NADPH2:quinone reductase